jgi:hypothetical protein
MSSLGGGIQGISVKQTSNSVRNSDHVMARRILRSSWNNSNVTSGRKIGAFRAVNNLGDVLNRQNYSCGGPNQVNSRPGIHGNDGGSIPQQCDGTGIAAASCNPKFVADSSDYIKFRKQRALSQNYNDSKFGGDQSNASYTPYMRVTR